MSEQIIETLPNPSTACNFRIIAFSFASFCVPTDKTIVTIELKASGIAATASATANTNASVNTVKFIPSLRNSSKPKTITHIPIMISDSFLPKLSRLSCNGVFFSCVLFNSDAILPISVSIPTDVTTIFALP